MRFIEHGPDVPERLVQLHRDGNVVFFCGAGISYPAGLPGFEGLVYQTFDGLHERMEPAEALAHKQRRYDSVFELLERRLDDRPSVREHVLRILTPATASLTKPEAIATHQALLTLSKTKEGTRRLVTTNFDRLFFEADSSHLCCQAPHLPIPKKSKWDGVVYLHGLMPERLDPTALNRLVLSSGDFGLAYLTERWASRFVSELFRDYVVCFVGYSVEDPVMRYMVDALSADRLLGEERHEVHAFAPHGRGKKAANRAREVWAAKGIDPILYVAKGDDHSRLHGTLKRWAEVFRDGLTGKRSIISREASGKPSRVIGDGQVDRVTWALSDPSGAPAKEFAEMSPSPPVDWLSVLDEKGMLDKGCPTEYAPRLALAGPSSVIRGAARLDPVTHHLARWFVHHLEEADALAWVIKKGGCLHPTLKELIEGELRSAQPPKAPISTIWEIIASGKACSTGDGYGSLFAWADRLSKLGWNSIRKRELLELLSPTVRFRPPMDWSSIFTEPGRKDTRQGAKRRTKEFADWDIELAAGESIQHYLDDLSKRPGWGDILVDLLPALTDLLLEAIDLMELLGEASDKSDGSYHHRPSISNHEQNREFHSWTTIITLLRDGWVNAAAKWPAGARREFDRWSGLRFPIFKRMAMFAAANSSIVPRKEAIDLLLARDAWWLWSVETQREAFRLLATLAPQLVSADQDAARLWTAILLGLPRKMFRADIEADQWTDLTSHAKWLHLKKLEHFGATLPSNARVALDELSKAHPEWKLAEDDRDEFPSWMEGGFGTAASWQRSVVLPRRRRALADELLKRPKEDFWYEDDWADICRAKPSLAVTTLLQLARDGNWPPAVWRTALQVFGEEKFVRRAWHRLAAVLLGSPEAAFAELCSAIAWWIHTVTGVVGDQTLSTFLDLVNRVLDQNYETDKAGNVDPVMTAINHPVGHVVQALMKVWFAQKPTAGLGLPQSLLPTFNKIADESILIFRLGRVILAAQLAGLHSVDPKWTEAQLLPKFDWEKNATEASAVWEGYLWSPRINPELVAAFKGDFLETARWFDRLGEHKLIYAQLLTVAALELANSFKGAELGRAFNALPQEGLVDGARVIQRSLEAVGEDRDAYWNNRAKRVLSELWPKSANKRSAPESGALADVCVAAGPALEDAVETVIRFLQPTRHVSFVAHQLKKTDLPMQFPVSVLRLLAAIAATDENWPGSDLRDVVNVCSQTSPAVKESPDYRKLNEHLLRMGY